VAILTRRSPVSLRTTFLAVLALGVVLIALFAASAGAVVTASGGHQYGVQPEATGITQSATPLTYEGGPVVHGNELYAVYWDPSAGAYSGYWQESISGFLAELASASGLLSNVFATTEQYRDTTGASAAYDSRFWGDYTDVDPYPVSGNCVATAPCLTDAQVRTELGNYITANGLPTGLDPSSGRTPIYFVFTPPGTTICLGSTNEHCSKSGTEHPLCSYHSFIPASGTLASTVLYAVEPWTAGNLGTVGASPVSGSKCQDGTGTLQEPNQVGMTDNDEFNAGLADLIINDVTNELVSTVTDPLFTAWHDTGGDSDELVDKCRNDFLGGLLTELPGSETEPNTEAGTTDNETIGRNFYLNDTFDQAALYAPYPGVRCVNHVNLRSVFSVHSTANSGTAQTFSASQSEASQGIAAYHWDFGDGTSTTVNCEGRTPTYGYSPAQCTGSSGTGNPNSAASVVHSYTYGGEYPVTLTLTDDGGNTTSTTNTVTVSGPAPPSPPPSHSEGATTGTTTGSTSSSSASTTSATTPTTTSSAGSGKPVVATQAVASHSLSTALKEGIVVRYSVSEKATGRFEVLLASSTAHKLGLRGASATGLAKGTPAQTIIANAILVATKGGGSTYKIKFSKATAAKLRKLRKVTLMIRLSVHNAASPTATTVLDTVNLH
jgi:hypothetical protein